MEATTNTHATLAKVATLELCKEFIAAHGIPTSEDMEHGSAMSLALRLGGTKTQSNAAATIINIAKGQIAGRDLTAILQELYPNNSKIGKSHGPYYLSHARRGKLKGCNFVPPTNVTSHAASATVNTELSQVKSELNDALTKVASYEALLGRIMQCRSIKEVRTVMNGVELPAEE